MHSAVPQSHYEWPRCSQATREIRFTTNANKKIGVTICNSQANKGSIEGAIPIYLI